MQLATSQGPVKPSVNACMLQKLRPKNSMERVTHHKILQYKNDTMNSDLEGLKMDSCISKLRNSSKTCGSLSFSL